MGGFAATTEMQLKQTKDPVSESKAAAGGSAPTVEVDIQRLPHPSDGVIASNDGRLCLRSTKSHSPGDQIFAFGQLLIDLCCCVPAKAHATGRE